MNDLKKMTKAQLIEELIRARNEPCGCCGVTPKEWEETPLLDPVEPDRSIDESEPIFVPTVWGTVEEPEDDCEEENE